MPTPNDLTDAEINQRLAELMGMDLTAKTDEISQAILDACVTFHSQGQYIRYEWNGRTEEFRGIRVYLDGDKAFGEHLWANREGQPWQDDLEAHVAAYRRTPPNWAGSLELAFELGSEMIYRQFDTEYMQSLVAEALKIGGETCIEFNLAHMGPRERALAALRTLEVAKDDR